MAESFSEHPGYSLEELNETQLRAVTATEGYIRVVAGAGSGKTRALSHRFAYLVNELGVMPDHILCATFTNKAANEMRARIRKLIRDTDTGYIGTFHSFCVSVLQEDAHAVGYPGSFLVLDNSDIDAMLAQIYEERSLTLRDMTYKDARDMFEIRKVKEDPEYYRDMIAMPLEILRSKYLEAETVRDILFYGYLYQEKKCFGLDYNDLIKFTLHIFGECPEIREKWQKRLEYVMVDEFQDIDDLQYRLMEVLCGYHGNLFIVGDPDQTIYTWRGANVRYLMDFDKHFPGTETIMMMENYRSRPPVLKAANSLIGKNTLRMKKDLIPMRTGGKRPLWMHCATAALEAERIAKEIRTLQGEGVQLKDIAVLYRAHYVSRALEEVFLKEKLPYVLYSGTQFYNRAEIKDALSYLRMIAFRDDLAFARVVNTPKRNIGEQRMRFLRDYAEQNRCLLYTALKRNADDPLFARTGAKRFIDLIERFSGSFRGMRVSELLARVLEESGYEEMLRTEGSSERLDDLAELKQSVYEYETTCGEETALEDYLKHIALFTNSDREQSREAVKCMTVHTAKGLEFPYVFLCAMEEGVFPAKKTASRAAMEEERRLAFVAVTRAMERLYLSDSGGKNLDGSFRYPSRFLLDIDRKLVLRENEPEASYLRRAEEEIRFSERDLDVRSAEKFAPGTRVVHPVLGAGEVLSVDADKGAYMVRFDALKTERSVSFRVALKREA